MRITNCGIYVRLTRRDSCELTNVTILAALHARCGDPLMLLHVAVLIIPMILYLLISLSLLHGLDAAMCSIVPMDIAIFSTPVQNKR